MPLNTMYPLSAPNILLLERPLVRFRGSCRVDWGPVLAVTAAIMVVDNEKGQVNHIPSERPCPGGSCELRGTAPLPECTST